MAEGREKSRRVYVMMKPCMLGAVRDTAALNGQGVAEYIREAVRLKLKADDKAARPSSHRLTPAQLIRLDQQLQKMGIDLGKVAQE